MGERALVHPGRQRLEGRGAQHGHVVVVADVDRLVLDRAVAVLDHARVGALEPRSVVARITAGVESHRHRALRGRLGVVRVRALVAERRVLDELDGLAHQRHGHRRVGGGHHLGRRLVDVRAPRQGHHQPGAPTAREDRRLHHHVSERVVLRRRRRSVRTDRRVLAEARLVVFPAQLVASAVIVDHLIGGLHHQHRRGAVEDHATLRVPERLHHPAHRPRRPRRRQRHQRRDRDAPSPSILHPFLPSRPSLAVTRPRGRRPRNLDKLWGGTEQAPCPGPPSPRRGSTEVLHARRPRHPVRRAACQRVPPLARVRSVW